MLVVVVGDVVLVDVVDDVVGYEFVEFVVVGYVVFDD